MTELIFVDSNVLIYAFDEGNPGKRDVARAWREALWKGRNGRVSFQVLYEFYVNVRKKWPPAAKLARAEVRDLLAWNPIAPNAVILEESWKIQDRYRLSFWDALIVAAAKACSCRYLLTEDLQPDQDLNGLLVINPFLHSPASFSALQ